MSPSPATPPVSARPVAQGQRALGGDVEQDPPVDVVGQEPRRSGGDPGGGGDGRDLGEDLRGGVAAADDHDALPAERVGPAVGHGVELGAAEGVRCRGSGASAVGATCRSR